MDLEGAKKRLVEALRDKTQRYWELMKNWYKRRISKDEFDGKARSLLGEANVPLHNEFLFAILVKCQTGAHRDTQQMVGGSPHAPFSVPAGVKAKLKRPKLDTTTSTEMIPYGALDAFQYHSPPSVHLHGKDLDTLLLCSHEMLLPDLPTLHTRMLLGAWEAGLEGVSEEAAQLLMLALKQHLKNVISACIAHHSSWRLRGGTFQHSFGNGLASRAIGRRRGEGGGRRRGAEIDEETDDVAALAKQSMSRKPMESLTLFHLRDTLQVSRISVPVHSVYTCNMERILAGMWHASREEEEQQREVEEWRRTVEHPIPFSITSTGLRKR